MVRERIYEMLQLQNDLNNRTNGLQWREGITQKGKVINWKRAIYMEGMELIDSFPWKHWKSIDSAPDYENMEIELVDIWHFLMSYLLQHNPLGEAAQIIEEALGSRSDIRIPRQWGAQENRALDSYLDPFEELIALALIKGDSPELQRLLTEQFFKACDAVGLPFDTLYRLYIGKNALNQFRQDHGYREGSYRKIWGEREDNEVLQEILQENPTISYPLLMEELAKRYPTL
ncbi:MAG: dUTPase [Epsilonproteobacteria bacterium]|nr:dUTPase [Campylobacterota bacterium]NPA56537.1 dUTPase [Campylobacterota bacterium]